MARVTGPDKIQIVTAMTSTVLAVVTTVAGADLGPVVCFELGPVGGCALEAPAEPATPTPIPASLPSTGPPTTDLAQLVTCGASNERRRAVRVVS